MSETNTDPQKIKTHIESKPENELNKLVDEVNELEDEVNKLEEEPQKEKEKMSDEETQKILLECQEKINELYETLSQTELRQKCEALFEMSKEECKEIPLAERMALVMLKSSFEQLDAIETGLKFIRESYKSKHVGQLLSEEDGKLVTSTIEKIWTCINRVEKYPSRILVARTEPIKATTGVPVGILRQGRDHPLRPVDDTLEIPDFISQIDKKYAEGIVYVDKDVPGEFTGYLLQEVKYFEKTADEVGKGLSHVQWADLEADFYSFAIHPIDTCMEEFRDIGYAICPYKDDEEKEKTYQTVVFRTWMVDLTEEKGLVVCPV